MNNNNQYDIFISYRRDGGEIMARLLYFMLTSRGYTVFYDREAMDSGRFDENIRNAIESCTDFILILSHHIFDGRIPEEDNVLAEIKYARQHNKNILPLLMPGFDYEEMKDYRMPEELSDFDKIHATPIIIPSFDYNYISKNVRLKSKPSNKSGVLTEALELGNDEYSEVAPAFNDVPDHVKKEALRNILVSYMEKENADMIMSMIRPYLEKKFNEKKDFRYNLNITSLKSSGAMLCKLPFENIKDKYCRLYERLSFSKHYIKTDGLDEIWMALTFDDGSLDDNLHDDKVFFSESLKLRKEDIAIIKNMSDEEVRNMIDAYFKVKVAINGDVLSYYEAEVTDGGIFMKYRLGKKLAVIKFKASFEIPFDYNNNFLYISISEPTFSPEILIEFQEDYFEANLIPFFDDSMKLTESTSFEGEFEMRAEDLWIMPMSGAIVNIREKDLSDDE